MPTYTYECPSCGAFEAFHGMREKIAACPACGRDVRRLVVPNFAGVIFKGAGFHCNDYKKLARSGRPAATKDVLTTLAGDVCGVYEPEEITGEAGMGDSQNVKVVRGQFTEREIADMRRGRKKLVVTGAQKGKVFTEARVVDSDLPQDGETR